MVNNKENQLSNSCSAKIILLL